MPHAEEAVEQAPSTSEEQDPPLAVVRMLTHDPRKTQDLFWRGFRAEGAWRDRGQYGRLAMEEMYKNAIVAGAFNLLLAFIKSATAGYSPRSSKPTDREKEMSQFLNDQMHRFDWQELLDGFFGSGLQFGFALAEQELITAPWRHGNELRKQVKAIRVLPQASLDSGEMPREELGEVVVQDPRYHCFDLADNGSVLRVYQWRDSTIKPLKDVMGLPVVWEGADLLNVLHYKHKGGDGSPYGESLFYSAYRAWESLFTLETAEDVFLQLCSIPFLTASRKADAPSPEFNEQLKDMVQNTELFRLLVGTNVTWGKVSAADKDFAQHIKNRKDELKQDIASAIGVPENAFRSTDMNERNARDQLMAFLRFRLPEVTKSISRFMVRTFGKRLIDANYSNVKPGEYPEFNFRLVLDSDLKASMQLLSQAYDDVDAERLGEFLESVVPGFRREFIPEDHKDSVAVKRPRRDSNDPHPMDGETGSTVNPRTDSKNNPPDKSGSFGEERESKKDGI